MIAEEHVLAVEELLHDTARLANRLLCAPTHSAYYCVNSAWLELERAAALLRSDVLVTCPECGQPGFSPRGLKSHLGNKTCRRRKAGAK